MRKLGIFLAAALFFPAASFAVEMRLPAPQLETLPNGLTLAWFLDDSLPVVDMAVLVKSGHRDDPAGKSGTSELLASALDRGNAGLKAQEIARQIEAMGASEYVSADEDTFSIGTHGLAPDADKLLDLLAKIVTQPEFPEDEVKREHARLLDRWRHIEDYGETLAAIAYRRILTAGTSYGRGGFTSTKEFEKVGRADVLAFHQKHFTPRNTILMVVGRVEKAAFKQKIEAAFGGWKGEAPQHAWKSYTDKRLASKPGSIVVVDRPSLTQAQVRIGFRGPLINSPDHYSLVVGNALLGEYFHSRLNSLIRDKLGLTYGISSSFSYTKELGTFTVSAATGNETVGQLVRKTVEVLKGVKKGPIDAEEVSMAKDYLIGSFPLSMSTLGAAASRWLAGYIFDLGPDYLSEFVSKVKAVTREEVSQAMAKRMDPDHAVIVIAGDAKAIEKSLKAAGYASVRRASVADLF